MSDTTTALAVTIPDQFHDQINEIRSQQDRAFPRWMPHINFIFPFVSIDQFDTVHTELKKVFESHGITDFDIAFEEIGYFSQAKQSTFHLKPNNESKKKLQTIHKIICDALPWVDVKTHGNEFSPHCTISQCPKKDTVNKEKELTEWFNKTFNGKLTVRCDKVCMLKRSPESNDMMFVKNFVGLNHNNDTEYDR